MLIDFYMFRPYFLTFYGPERIPPEAGDHAHESPGVMTVPAGGPGVRVGWRWGRISSGRTVSRDFLAATPSLAYLADGGRRTAAAERPSTGASASLSTAITLVGHRGWPPCVYLGSREKAARLARLMNVFGLYSLSYGKFFFDPIYTLLVVWPLLGVARLAAWFDRCVIDGLVDLCGRLPALLGAALRPVQNGLVQFYALAMVLGLLALLGALLM